MIKDSTEEKKKNHIKSMNSSSHSSSKSPNTASPRSKMASSGHSSTSLSLSFSKLF